MTRARHLVLAGFAALSLLSSIAASFAQVPAPVPALPDAERRTSYSITASTCACSLGANLNLYGDSNDFWNWLEVYLNGVRVNYNDATYGWTITSQSGQPLSNLARPITDGVLTFNSAQTGTVQIVGARRPRRVSQFNENAGIPARNVNQVVTDITATLRELWDKTNDMTGRGLFSQPGNTVGPLPLPAVCVNAFLAFDGTGANPLCQQIVSAGSLSTPGGTTNNDIATWTGTTGKQLGDSGVGFPIPINKGGTGQITAPAALTALIPSTSSVGAILQWNGSAWVPTLPRTVLTGNATYYIRSDGSNGSCNGTANASSASSPNCGWATPQYAISWVQANIDLAGFAVTLQFGQAGSTTWSTNIICSQPFVGGNNVTLQGQSGWASQSTATIISGAAATGIFVSGGCQLTLNQLAFVNAAQSGNAVVCFGSGGAALNFENILWAGGASSDIFVSQGCETQQIGQDIINYTVSGGTTWHIQASHHGEFRNAGQTTTLGGGLQNTIFAYADYLGIIVYTASPTINLNGQTAIAQRCYAADNAIVEQAGLGATFFPGNTACGTATGGLLVQ
jgi:hypothetical protein